MIINYGNSVELIEKHPGGDRSDNNKDLILLDGIHCVLRRKGRV